MYVAIIAFLLLLAAGLVILGLRKGKRLLTATGIVVGIGTFLFFWFCGFYAEALWFYAVGYQERFWTVILSKAGLAVLAALVSLLIVGFMTWRATMQRHILRAAVLILSLYIGSQWGFANWDRILLFLNRVEAQVSDPVFGLDISFYFFVLPFLDTITVLLSLITLIAVTASAVSAFVVFNGHEPQLRVPTGRTDGEDALPRHLYLNVAAFLVVLALVAYLQRFHLLQSMEGVVAGAGWTDVHVRLPAYSIMVVLLLAAAVFLSLAGLRRRVGALTQRFASGRTFGGVAALAVAIVLPLVGWFILLIAVPALTQWLYVQPNEITVEKPYISHNIEFTRHAYGLSDIEEGRFPVTDSFSRDMVERNEGLFENIRLWDYRVLDAIYRQFQEIRLYYEFEDVDVDRYTVADRRRQVMISAREMQPGNLPEQSQTFVNKRFKYTHGYGLTLTTVHEFTADGLPNLLVKNIPPEWTTPDLKVERPQIYYGESTVSHVIANTQEPEFDYPRGEENVYVKYPGQGGVKWSSFWRRFIYGWKFDGTRLFMSTYPTGESRIMFHRHIIERVRLLAPFLEFDDDPYIVLADGQLYWMIDAYTISSDYPYSESFASATAAINEKYTPMFVSDGRQRRYMNYIRNSVKAVVNAFDGSVNFYIFEPDDPLVQTWAAIFPGLLKKREEMPPELLKHIRYPSDMLLTQGLVYAKYHMTDPGVFYNQEDLWVRATEKYYNQVQPVEPYYILWERMDTDNLEFIQMLPFTPKHRQVLIGWVAGMCDPANYGRLLAFKFPKEKRVLGTQQMETKIDQDAYLSAQLSLWDQRGSRVIRGNVLVIPVEDTLLYVEPIYLQAETAAYPELRIVALMHNDRLSYAETFDEALEGLFEDRPPKPSGLAPVQPTGTSELAGKANNAFEGYLQAIGEGDFDGAATQLKKLQQVLQQLSDSANELSPADANQPELQ